MVKDCKILEKRLKTFKKEVRQAVADYMRSEGCGCCGDRESHDKHSAALGKLLGVPKYSDGSGYDFSKFRTKN